MFLWDQHQIEKGGSFLSSFPIQAEMPWPIEMAERAKANGNKVIAITSVEQSKKYPVRIKGQKETL